MDLLSAVYILNLTFLILHEMDSAYWKEWELFKLPGGISLFLIIHFPLYIIALYGLITLPARTNTSLIISLLLGLIGVAALVIHGYFLFLKNKPQFKTMTSIIILTTTFLFSTTQIILTIKEMGWLRF